MDGREVGHPAGRPAGHVGGAPGERVRARESADNAPRPELADRPSDGLPPARDSRAAGPGARCGGDPERSGPTAADRLPPDRGDRPGAHGVDGDAAAARAGAVRACRRSSRWLATRMCHGCWSRCGSTSGSAWRSRSSCAQAPASRRPGGPLFMDCTRDAVLADRCEAEIAWARRIAPADRRVCCRARNTHSRTLARQSRRCRRCSRSRTSASATGTASASSWC